jgi:hypothetical protein
LAVASGEFARKSTYYHNSPRKVRLKASHGNGNKENKDAFTRMENDPEGILLYLFSRQENRDKKAISRRERTTV